jgi:hypothetical protein
LIRSFAYEIGGKELPDVGGGRTKWDVVERKIAIN